MFLLLFLMAQVFDGVTSQFGDIYWKISDQFADNYSMYDQLHIVFVFVANNG